MKKRIFLVILAVVLVVSLGTFAACGEEVVVDGEEYSLKITAIGEGTTSPKPGTSTITEGESVTVTAKPDTGYKLDRWEGDVSGTKTSITVKMTSDKSVVAVFVKGVVVDEEPVGGPKYGGILHVPYQDDPGGFDMNRKPSYGPTLGYMVFSNLIYFDPFSVDIGYDALRPDLAESWETSADGKTVTFFLYKGVKWHDGEPFTADDVVYSLEKLVDPERSSISGSFPSFERAEKVDDYTVKVHLKAASPSFLAQLAGPYAAVQAEHMADVNWKSIDYLVGTGPFKYKSHTPGVTYEMERNPDYHKKDKDGNQLPYLDGVTIYIMMERSVQIDSFITKRVDITQPFVSIVTEEALQKCRDLAPDADYYIHKDPYGAVLWFNTNYEPLKDVRVRRALAMLLDQRQMMIAGGGSERWATYDYGLMFPAYGISRAEVDKLLGWDMTYEERVAEAKRLMAEAGYAEGEGFEMMIPTRDKPDSQRRNSWIADAFRRIGVDLELRVMGTAEMREREASRGFHLMEANTFAYACDPDELMPYFLTGSPANYSGYSNPELDRLWELQSVENDVAKRKLIVQEIERIILRDVPIVPLAFDICYHGTWPYVKNYVIQNVGYGSRLKFEQVWLDK